MLYNKDLNTINKKASTKYSKQKKTTKKQKISIKNPIKTSEQKEKPQLKKIPTPKQFYWNVYYIEMFTPLECFLHWIEKKLCRTMTMLKQWNELKKLKVRGLSEATISKIPKLVTKSVYKALQRIKIGFKSFICRCIHQISGIKTNIIFTDR